MRYLFWGAAPKYECENEAPNVFYDSVQIVAVNENMKWREVIILKPEQIEEHSSSNAVGHTVEVSSPKGYEKTRVRFVLVVNHHRPVLQSPTAEKVDIDVGPEIGELEVIRKSRSFLQTIDIYVDTTFDFGTSISSIEVNINYKLAPKQQYCHKFRLCRASRVQSLFATDRDDCTLTYGHSCPSVAAVVGMNTKRGIYVPTQRVTSISTESKAIVGSLREIFYHAC
jgi:hypothetical protein